MIDTDSKRPGVPGGASGGPPTPTRNSGAASRVRRAAAELVATGGLVCAVIGSGIMAQRLSPGDVGLQLLENSVATTLALLALILTFGALSGAHMNPVVSVTEALRGALPVREAPWFVLAQVAGGVLGAIAANAMFETPLVQLSTHVRSGVGVFVGEVVATAGLLLVIRGTARSNPKAIPLAVAAYIGAAYWFTSSTSFANPAVTVARMLSDSFAGIAPASVPAFVAAQVVGAALALGAGGLLMPDPAPDREAR
jgi:arsenate reductase